jgi:hypothetical protein
MIFRLFRLGGEMATERPEMKYRQTDEAAIPRDCASFLDEGWGSSLSAITAARPSSG